MATKLTENTLKKIRDLIHDFDFKTLFNQLGWSKPLDNRNITVTVNAQELTYQQIAQLSGVVVLHVANIPDSKTRLALHDEISRIHHEHLLIFVDNEKTQSCWSWLKREGKKALPRSHSYFKGQSGDLLLSKIVNMMVEFTELEQGDFSIVDVTSRLRNALDIEPVTKKFFKDFADLHSDFVEQILGIPNEKHRAWYASVLLHRLMFIWFLQKKSFVDKGNTHYLKDKLDYFQSTLKIDCYYKEFLKPLFFEGFAKPKNERSKETNQLLGEIRYLNGGLFLPHQIEERYPDIQVNDKAFSDLYDLFKKYSWNLNDTIGGADDEINPDVLGYIFEKYINQKAFGAYYTRPEITDYLCERTISKLILDRINTNYNFEVETQNFASLQTYQFKDLPELLFKLDAPLCKKLLHDVLPNLSLLDPACGSGAFLVAAMKMLINVYAAIIGKIIFLHDAHLTQWLENTKKEHPSIDYFIKKEIIKNNLFGVDIMPEATEIAKLRLFLALVSSARKVEELEPLPNIDFNIMAGNSLIGLLNVEGEKFNQLGKTGDIFLDNEAQTYSQILQEKNRLIASYKDAQTYSQNLALLRDNISEVKRKAYRKLNKLLLAEFERLQIKFEQATWDEAKNKEGKPIKRALTLLDIESLQPFHWGYEFDAIFARGGFDAIITNPPWEALEPNGKEFFQEYNALFSKNKMTIKDYEKEIREILKQDDVKKAWLDYHSSYNHQRLFFRIAGQYKNQVPIIDGKKHGKDVNLYKLFTEQSFNLLKENGECGIVIPSGIYSDLGAKSLRDLLFNHTEITGLFCFENNKLIFEGVHRSFKFVVLTFKKDSETTIFPAEFMRHEVSELANFPNQNSLYLHTDLIKKLSPDSHSIMEFKSALDVKIAEKMLSVPLLGEYLKDTWNLELHREFNMTDDNYLFKTESSESSLPMYEGKMIHQFSSSWGEPRYWIDESEGREAILGRTEDDGQELGYQKYRLAYRSVASSTNERTLISTIIPPCFTGNSINISESLNAYGLLICVSFFNSFVIDWLLRQKVSANINMFYIYQLPIPRLTEKDPQFKPIVERAAALICTTPEFDDLRAELAEQGYTVRPELVEGRGSTSSPRTDFQIRAELDAIIAHLYGLTESEFAHILKTFPIVKEEIKTAAMVEFKKLAQETLK